MIKSAVALAALLAMSSAVAIPVLKQTPQGDYTSNVIGGGAWTTFSALAQAQHSFTSTADFSNLAQLNLFDAVWVDQELGNALAANEISSLHTYVSAGNKLVLFAENQLWTAWNDSVMSIVGGSVNNTCSFGIGTSLVANSLTAGVTSVANICGSTLTNTGNPTMLFSNNMAALYSVGAGQALVITDANWNGNGYIGNNGNAVFAQNVVNWLGVPVATVPEPGSIALLGLGLAGLAAARRKRRPAAR